MTIGEKIKKLRKEKKIPVEYIAKELGVSCSTIYRYEDSSIEKIPINVITKLAAIFEVSPAQLMQEQNFTTPDTLPREFDNPQDAMEFIIKMPVLAAFGGYNPESMSDEMIIEFANELLVQLRLVSYKYRDTNTFEK